MRVLLDTDIIIYWCSEPDRLGPSQRHALSLVSKDNPAIVADISLWEIAMLALSGKIQLSYPVREWLNRAVAPPLVRIAPISPSVAGELSVCADWANRDPADRLIVATARIYGAHVLTNDERIKSSELVSVI